MSQLAEACLRRLPVLAAWASIATKRWLMAIMFASFVSFTSIIKSPRYSMLLLIFLSR